MTRTRILLAALVAAMAVPATASAATVTLRNGTATFTAASGEANHLTIDYEGTGNAYMAFEDTGVTSMTAGAGCSSVGAQTVRCPTTAVTTSVVVDLGDGNDYLGSGVFSRPSTVYGGLGNDTIHSGFGSDVVDAGAGTDTIDGWWGDDVIDGGDGADSIAGNTGRDKVTYASRTAGVSVSLDGTANDGATGEGDNVAASVEDLIGGAGNDALTGDDDANTIFGGAGNDSLSGQGDVDSLEGGAGVDAHSGGAGVDTIAARDGTAETVACGTEADVATVDYADTVDADCEAVDRSAPTDLPPPVGPDAPPTTVELPPVLPPAPTGGTGNVIEAPVATIPSTPVPVTDDGVAQIRIKCPSEAFEGCAGSILIEGLDATGKGRLAVESARRRKTKLATRRFKVAAGQGATIPVRFDRRSWRRFKNRKRVKVQITVTMENATGTTTNTRTVALRRVPAKKKKKRRR